jgi:nucleoside-diphosphate-sugar epimerase
MTTRILIAGITGVLGRRIAPLLVADGHAVTGISRSGRGADELRAVGVEILIGDVYDLDWLLDAMRTHRADVVMNQLTDLPDDAADLDAHRADNARIRRIGTDHLLQGAAASGADLVITQSVAWTIPGEGGRSVQSMEDAVLAIDGVVVRYGQLYGPDTYYPDTIPPTPRIHVDAAARLTLPALDGRKQVLTLVEDDAPPASAAVER